MDDHFDTSGVFEISKFDISKFACTYNKNLRARGPILLELFPFVTLNVFCIDSFFNILNSH